MLKFPGVAWFNRTIPPYLWFLPNNNPPSPSAPFHQGAEMKGTAQLAKSRAAVPDGVLPDLGEIPWFVEIQQMPGSNPSRLGKGTSNISGILRLCLNMWKYSHENWGSCADRVNVTTWISGMRGTKTIPLRWFQSKTYQEYAHLRYLTWSDRYCLMLPPVGHRWT